MKKATKLYKNGVVITLNKDNLVADSLAVCEDRIIAVGSRDEVAAYQAEDTEVIDLAGKALLPGFYDSHGHINSAGDTYMYKADLNCPPIGTCLTIEDCLNAMRELAARKPEGAVLGAGYDDTLIAEKRHLTRHDLDKVSIDRPVVAKHISGHLAYLNTKALEMIGYTEETEDPAGGVIQREVGTRIPNGVLEENAAFHPNIRALELFTDEQKQASLVYITGEYAKQGVTTASCGLLYTNAQMALYKQVEDQLKTRMFINPFMIDYEKITEGFTTSNKIVLSGGKELADGSLQGYTGYLTKPYHINLPGQPDYRGYPTNEKAELTARIVEAYRKDIQPVVHCNGDAALDDYLDALEEAQKAYPGKELRPVVIHCQTAREDQLDRIKELGATVSFFVLHTYYWGDRHRDIFLGPERAARLDPLQSALKRGIIFSTHCDSPITPQRPLLSIWASVNRISSNGNVIGAEQRIPVMDALRAYTINAAYQNFEETERGSLEAGKYADLVILSEDILSCEPEHIRDIEVEETILAGRTTYKNK